MAVKQVTRYEATDGTLFTDEREAQKYQDSLNTVDRDVFRKETFEKFITTQLRSEDEDLANLYKRLVKDDLTFDESQPFFERVWLGTIKNTKLNQQIDYLTMLNTILGNDEAHLKVDGTYSFTIDGGAKFLMTKKTGPDGVPFDLNVSLSEGGESYRLSTVNGRDGRTFTLTRTDKGTTIIGTGLIFTNNILTLKDIKTYTITWNG